MNYTKLIVLFAAFLDVLGIGIIIPSLPGLQGYFGVSAFLISMSLTTYAIASFLAGPVLGQLGDRYGRKPIFFICVLGSMLSWFTIALSPNYRVFIIGRVINGITGGNISIIQAILSDISKDSKERIANLGLFGAIFGSAFIIGPFIGGVMIHMFGDLGPFWLAGILSLIELILIAIKMKETHTERQKRKISLNPMKIIIKGLINPAINKYLYSYMFLLLGIMIFQSTFSIYLSNVYGVPGYMTGYILSGVGVLQILNQVFLMKHFWLKYFGEKNMIMMINITVLLLFIILIFVTSFNIFLILVLIMMMIGSLSNPMYQGEVLEKTDKHFKGEVMGVFGSVMSLNMGIGSMIGGYLLAENMNMFVISSLCILISLIIVINIFKSEKKEHISQI